MCEWAPGTSASPDRMDALVWGLTELSDDYSGTHGLIEYMSSGMAERDLHRPPIAAPTPEPPPRSQGSPDVACPSCSSRAIARCGSGLRCNQCGHRWGDQQAVLRGPSRKQLLAGDWHCGGGKIRRM